MGEYLLLLKCWFPLSSKYFFFGGGSSEAGGVSTGEVYTGWISIGFSGECQSVFSSFSKSSAAEFYG